MAKAIRRTNKPGAPKQTSVASSGEPKETKQREVSMVKGKDEFTVSIGETVPTGEFKNMKFSVTRTKSVIKDVDTEMDEVAEFLDGKLTEYVEKYVVVDEEFGEEEGEEGEEGEEFGEEEGEEGEEGDDITEEEIRSMKKAELMKIIEDEELDIDVSKIKKIGDLREAVVGALFEEDEGEEGEEGEEWEEGEDWEDED